MKLMHGKTPLKSVKVGTNTDDATFIASDLQAGKTGYSRGRKVTGTGKSFEFANYGQLKTNASRYIPSNINIIELASTEYPIKLSLVLSDLKTLDFSTSQKIATVIIDGIDYDLTVSVNSNILKIDCDKTFYLQVFYGKDNYV